MNKDDNGLGRERRLVRDALVVKLRAVRRMCVWCQKRFCESPNAGERVLDGGSCDVSVKSISRHIHHKLNKRIETKAAR